MSTLKQSVHDYLALRRSLGFKLRAAEDALAEFVVFAEQRGITRITAAIAVEWALSRSSTRPGSAADRLRHVRGFARHHLASDPATEIPPVDLLPSRLRRRQPYLYSDDEVSRLLACSLNLPPADGLRPWTYHCFLGLLAATGLRLGEAIRLDVGDVDLEQGVLTIRQTKFGKSRLVPVDTSTVAALDGYQTRRDRFFRGRPQRRFFVSGKGSRSTRARSTGRSMGCSIRLRSTPLQTHPGRACTIFAIDSPFRPCCAGTGLATRSSGGCPSCRPTWGTCASRTPTGTSALARN